METAYYNIQSHCFIASTVTEKMVKIKMVQPDQFWMTKGPAEPIMAK